MGFKMILSVLIRNTNKNEIKYVNGLTFNISVLTINETHPKILRKSLQFVMILCLRPEIQNKVALKIK